MNEKDIKVEKKGQIHKVFCQKTGELTLLVNCHDCFQFKGYDIVNKTVKCKSL